MNRRVWHLIAILGLLGLLAACRRPMPTGMPTFTPTRMPTATATPAATVTPTETSTLVLMPTCTAIPSPTKAPTSPPTPTASVPSIRLVSATQDGKPVGGDKGEVHLSADGRYAVYLTAMKYIYLRDLATETATPVNVAPDGKRGDDQSFAPSISADGSTVAFVSYASNLAEDAYRECPPGDSGKPEPCGSLYLYDVASGALERVLLAARWPSALDTSLSADARYVAVAVPDATLHEGTFLYDRETQSLMTISGSGLAVDISADGRYVAFASSQDQLVPGDVNGLCDVFVYDRDSGLVERISRPFDGIERGGESGFQFVPNTGGAFERGLAISADGRFVVFMSTMPNLVDRELPSCQHWDWVDSLPACRHIYLYDRQMGTMELISVSDDGTPGNRASEDGAVSADGRWVVFTSLADNLTADDPVECHYYTGICPQVYVRDRELGRTFLVSRDWDGEPADGASSDGAITPDGRYVAFLSGGSNLVPDVPASLERHIFVTTLSSQEQESGSETGHNMAGRSSKRDIA